MEFYFLKVVIVKYLYTVLRVLNFESCQFWNPNKIGAYLAHHVSLRQHRQYLVGIL